MAKHFVVVFGGRKFNNKKIFYRFMDRYHAKYKFTDVVSGGASGTDTLAIEWAKDNRLSVHIERAQWQDFREPCLRKSGPFGDYNALAGSNRNQLMIDKYKPQYAVEFPGGTGTADMSKRVAKHAKKTGCKHITIKQRNKEIFVFGSNTAGRHGKGAALEAKQKYGAIYGQGEGLQGSSYAIPTKDNKLNVLSLDNIADAIARFIEFALENPQLSFLITPVGCGLAGYKKKQIKPLFEDYGPLPRNCRFSETWED